LSVTIQHEWPQRLTAENVVEARDELKEFSSVDEVIKRLHIDVCMFLTVKTVYAYLVIHHFVPSTNEIFAFISICCSGCLRTGLFKVLDKFW